MEDFCRIRKTKVKAQGMVEFALVLPLLLLLIFGIIEAGRLLFIYSGAVTSSREAARYGAAAGQIGGNIAYYADCAGMRAAARRIGAWAGIGDEDISISYDHGPGTGDFAYCPLSATQRIQLGDRVSVRVVAIYRPLIPMVRFSSLPISATTRRTIIKDVLIEGTPPAASPPCVSFVLSEQSQEEDAGPMEVAVQLTAATSNAVVVPITLGGSATPGEDFDLNSTSVVFPPGETLRTITIDVIADIIYEPDEVVLLVMGEPTHALKCSPDVHMARILNDDQPPRVYFASSGQSQSEAYDGPIEILLSSPSSQPVTVHYTASGLAEGGAVDYSLAASPLVIAPGATSASMDIDVNDDNIDEDDEIFLVTIDAVENGTPAEPSAHAWTILDNDDPPAVFFTWEQQSGAETIGTMTVEAMLSVASSKEVTVPFSVGGSATRGTDYTIDATPFIIPPGALAASTQIEVIADADNGEVDETIVLEILTPTNAVRGSPGSHTAIITDVLVEPAVYFTPASQSGDETAGTMAFRAMLSAAYPLDVSVPFTLGGTATEGADYTITASPVVIPAGSAGADIKLTVLPDALDEFNETVVVSMGLPSNASKGSPDVHVATILDGNVEPSVSFASSGQTVPEGAGSVMIEVQLSSASGKPVSVPFTAVGSAQAGAGQDYTLPASPVIIAAGELSTSLTLQVMDDTLKEPTEEVTISLGTPANATLGSPAAHTVTILDNEPVCPAPDSLPYFGSGSNQDKLLAAVLWVGEQPGQVALDPAQP